MNKETRIDLRFLAALVSKLARGTLSLESPKFLQISGGLVLGFIETKSRRALALEVVAFSSPYS